MLCSLCTRVDHLPSLNLSFHSSNFRNITVMSSSVRGSVGALRQASAAAMAFRAGIRFASREAKRSAAAAAAAASPVRTGSTDVHPVLSCGKFSGLDDLNALPIAPSRAPESDEKVLLHSCCAPCSGAMIEEIQASGREVTIYFYNPNIHPRKEYELRKEENIKFAAKLGIPIVDADYDSDEWFKRAEGERGCRHAAHRKSWSWHCRLSRCPCGALQPLRCTLSPGHMAVNFDGVLGIPYP